MIDILLDLFNNFDPTALIPEIGVFLSKLELVARLAVLAGPLVMLGMGLLYLLIPPAEANYRFGYRTFFGMGSVAAWQYTQRLAGMILSGLGLVLTVVMGLICNGFRDMESMALVTVVIVCLILEVVLMAASYGAIEFLVFKNFDRHGKRRSEKRVERETRTPTK